MEPDSHGRSAQAGKDAADPGEQLAVDDHIEPLSPDPEQGQEAAPDKPPGGGVVQGQDVLRRNRLQDLQAFPVLLEEEHVEGHARELLLESRVHRVGQHKAAHLGEQDDQDPLRGGTGRRGLVSAMHNRQEPADPFAEYTVDFSLKFDFHRRPAVTSLCGTDRACNS